MMNLGLHKLSLQQRFEVFNLHGDRCSHINKDHSRCRARTRLRVIVRDGSEYHLLCARHASLKQATFREKPLFVMGEELSSG